MTKNFKREQNARRKPEPIVLRKNFATFKEAINAFRLFKQVFCDILGDDEDPTPAGCIAHATQDFEQYIPDLVNNDNVYVSISASTNKFSYRFDKENAIGWIIGYRIQDGHAVIENVSAQYTIFNNDITSAAELIGDGWVQQQVKERTNRKFTQKKDFDKKEDLNEAAE